MNPGLRLWAQGLVLCSIVLTSSHTLLAGPPGPPEITVEAIDVNAGPDHGHPSSPVIWNGQLFFSANDGFACSGNLPGEETGDELGEYGRELFTAGIGTGPILVKDINRQVSANCDGVGQLLQDYAAGLNDALIFRARPLGANDTGFEPWRTQGTEGTTEIVRDIYFFTNDSRPYGMTTVFGGTHVAFTATHGFYGTEPWITDGTQDGTHNAGNIAPDDYDSNPYFFTALNSSQFVFIADDDDVMDFELYVSDGTTSTLVKDINPEPNDSSDPHFLTTFVGREKVVFFAFDETAGNEPWVTDGTPAGTFRLADINPGPTSSNTDDDGDNAGFVQVSDQMYFSADDGLTGRELWVTDGTIGGTHMVTEIVAGPGGGYFAQAAAFQNLLYFAAPGIGLWRSDGTPGGTAPLVEGIFPSALRGLTAVGDLLYFSSSDELWVSDGTVAGTIMVDSFDTWAPNALTTVNSNALAFWAGNSTVGREMFLAYPTSLAPDTTGPSTAIGFGPTPIEALQPGALTATSSELNTGGADIADIEFQLDGGSWASMDPLDGTYDSPIETGLEMVSFPTPGTHQACVRGRDTLANVGDPLCMDIEVFAPDVVAPPPPTVDVVPNPVMIDTVATLTITASDVTTGNNRIAFIEYQIDGGNWFGMSASDGSYDEPTEQAQELIVFDDPGLIPVCARATDDANNTSNPGCVDVQVDAPDPTVRLRAIEVNQVIQNWRNEIPLYQRKVTVVRVFFEKIDSQTANFANGLLHGKIGNSPLPGSPLTTGSRATVGDDATEIDDPATTGTNESYRADLGNSLNFLLPVTWIDQGGTVNLEFELTSPTDGVLECAEPDVSPDCTVGVEFEPAAVPIMDFFAMPYDRSHIFELVVNATGGTYTLTSAGRESDPIAFNASSATVKDAAKDVFNADKDRVTVSCTGCGGSGIRTYTITVLRGDAESLVENDSSLAGSATITTEQTGGTSIAPSQDDMREQVRRVTDVFPIGRVDFRYRDSGDFNRAPTLTRSNTRIKKIRLMDRARLTFRAGLKSFGYLMETGPLSTGGGLAWAPNLSSSYAAFSEAPEGSGYARNRGGHETAHVFGRPHAVTRFRTPPPATSPTGKVGVCDARALLTAGFHPFVEDTGLPNPGAVEVADQTSWPTIGSLSLGFDDEIWGFSPRAFANGPDFWHLAVIDPRFSTALMSYCSPTENGQSRWVSSYAYDKLRQRLGSGNRSESRESAGFGIGDYVIVSGWIDQETGDVTLDPITTISGDDPGFEPGDVHVAIVDGVGGEIASQDVLLIEDGQHPANSDAPGSNPAAFVAAISLPEGTNPAAVVVEIDSQEVARINASLNPPTVQIDTPTVGTVASETIPIAWTAGDLDGDPLTATVLLSLEGGLTWETLVVDFEGTSYDFPVRYLKGSQLAQIQVLVSDGFHTSEATSDIFEVVAGDPIASIEIPVNGIAVPSGEILHLRGDAWDPEQGILNGNSLQWSVAVGAPFPGDLHLGFGEELGIPASSLNTGCQLITLTATGSGGRMGTDTVEVDIGATGCLGLFFADGFESGDTNEWSSVTP